MAQNHCKQTTQKKMVWKHHIYCKYKKKKLKNNLGVREIAAGVNPATPIYGDKPGSKLVWFENILEEI